MTSSIRQTSVPHRSREPVRRLLLVNLYPDGSQAPYQLSSYVLKAYLDKVLYDAGKTLAVEVVNFDAGTDVVAICREIGARQPDCVGYSCYVWNIEKVLRVVAALRGSTPGCVQVLGGPEISGSRVQALPNPALADYYVLGEGERPFARLIQLLAGHVDQDPVVLPPGVAHWYDGRLAFTENHQTVANLDEIPSVYLTGTLDPALYVRGQAFLETQRGCRFRCKYCVYNKQLPSISYYSLDRVLTELDHLIVDKQIMALRIFDAIFTSDLSRAKRIAEHLVQIKRTKRRRLPWIYWEFNYDSVDDEFLQLAAALKNRTRILNSARLRPLDRPQMYSEMLTDYTVINCVGVQSFDHQALKAVARPPVKPDRFEVFMARCRELNVVLKLDLILGLPFETMDTYFEGLEFLVPLLRDTDHVLNIHRLQILPGSDLEKRCEAFGIKYAGTAPHTVVSTAAFKEGALNQAARLTALLFRILNSPLRGDFFAALDRREGTVRSFLEALLSIAQTAPELKHASLVRAEALDDDYWNARVFEEVPSEWVAAILNQPVTG